MTNRLLRTEYCKECLYYGVCGGEKEPCNFFTLSRLSDYYPNDKKDFTCLNCINSVLNNESDSSCGLCAKLNIDIPEKRFQCKYHKLDQYKALRGQKFDINEGGE